LNIPFLAETSTKQRESLRASFCRVTMADVIEDVDVKATTASEGDSHCHKVTLRFHLLSKEDYKDSYPVKRKHILKYFETKFISKVQLYINR
jgi:hypothetical protein